MSRFLRQSPAFQLTSTVAIAAAMVAAAMIATATGGEETKWKKTPTEKVATKKFVLKKQIAVNPGGTLTVEADQGSIEVIPAKTNQVSVEVIRSIGGKYAQDAEAILEHHEVTFSEEGNNPILKSRLMPLEPGKVTVDGLGFDASEDIRQAMKNAIRKRLKNIHFRVTVPSQYNVKLKTGGQSIACGDLDGHVDCNTSGGGIKLGKITGLVKATTCGGALYLASAGDSVEMKTSGGSIRAGDIQGDADVATSGGSIHLGRVSGRVSAKTSGGSIRIVDAGGAVEAVTSGGSVNAAISQQPKADSYFATSGGSVNVALAEGLAFNIEHQGSGKASGPFLRKSSGSKSVNAKLNGGGPKLVTKGNVRFAYLTAN